MAAITDQGYQVTGLQMFHMEKANAEEFFEVYKGVVAEYIVSISNYMKWYLNVTLQL